MLASPVRITSSSRRRMRGPSPSAPARRAFTLVELVAVIVLVGVLGVAATASMASMASTRSSLALGEIERVIAYARVRSVATGEGTWVVFGVSSESYSVLGEDPNDPGRAGATSLTDPATGLDFSRTLGEGEFEGVAIVGADFDGDVEIGFDADGRPLNAEGDVLSSTGVLELTHAHELSVEPVTGRTWRSGP